MAQPKQWKKLDNAAKIFPPTSTGKDTKVFRFACELYDYIDADLLQHALDRTIKRFSYYRFVIRKGLFWYFFEESSTPPLVKEESEPPCSKIYNVDVPQLLFEVTYYKKRINLEVFHALSDGTGAMQFLKTLVTYYLTEKYAHALHDDIPTIQYDASQGQMVNDSFSKYYSKEKIKGKKKDKRAYRMKDIRLPENRIGVIEGCVQVKEMLSLVRRHGATVTEYLTAALIHSIHQTMRVTDEKLPVTVSIPVNLRNFFPSESSRNFFGVINVSHNFKQQGHEFTDILEGVKQSFKLQLTRENLGQIINRFTSLEHNVATKIVPLAIKIPSLKVAGLVADMGVTAAISNIGKIDLPPQLRDYVRLFDVFSSTQKLQICLCSYQDNMVISFTSPFVNTDVQRCFFRLLTREGIEVELNTNLEQKEGLQT